MMNVCGCAVGKPCPTASAPPPTAASSAGDLSSAFSIASLGSSTADPMRALWEETAGAICTIAVLHNELAVAICHIAMAVAAASKTSIRSAGLAAKCGVDEVFGPVGHSTCRSVGSARGSEHS